MGGGSRVPVGSGQQCVTVGALVLAHLPFTAPNRFSELSIPSAKVMLRHPQVPNPTPHLVPAACKSRPGRAVVPGSTVVEAGERWTTSLRSDCGHTQGPSQGWQAVARAETVPDQSGYCSWFPAASRAFLKSGFPSDKGCNSSMLLTAGGDLVLTTVMAAPRTKLSHLGLG